MKHLLLNKLLLTGILILFSTGFIFAQNISVQGKVTSEDNPDGILGVTVSAAGTTKATTTDTKGHFMLSDIRANDSLIFSFVGYREFTEAINGRKQINVTLQRVVSSLDQVVVIGY